MNSNKPAYPIYTDDMPVEGGSGLTKREKIAAMAMQGLLANPEESQRPLDNTAQLSVEAADELLKALEATDESANS